MGNIQAENSESMWLSIFSIMDPWTNGREGAATVPALCLFNGRFPPYEVKFDMFWLKKVLNGAPLAFSTRFNFIAV